MTAGLGGGIASGLVAGSEQPSYNQQGTLKVYVWLRLWDGVLFLTTLGGQFLRR